MSSFSGGPRYLLVVIGGVRCTQKEKKKKKKKSGGGLLVLGGAGLAELHTVASSVSELWVRSTIPSGVI